MGELTITTFLSLDGVMQSPGAPQEDPSGGFNYGGWVFPFADEDVNRAIHEFFSKADAFLLGRKTYDIFVGYWPRVDDPRDPIATAFNTLPKLVASRTKTSFGWMGARPVKDVVQEIPVLKGRIQREIQVHGSANLAQTLMKNDLIDEYRLLIYPVLLGRGKRLFNDGTLPSAFRLVRSSTTAMGVTINVYRRGGKLQTGPLHRAAGARQGAVLPPGPFLLRNGEG